MYMKIILLIILFLFSGSTFCESSENKDKTNKIPKPSRVDNNLPLKRWIQDSKGCRFLDPDAKYPIETISWSGQCANGFVEGTGRVSLPRRGWTFEGSFHDGSMIHGKGVRTNGTYEGEFKDNLPEGVGVLALNVGDIYSGEFRNGEPNGKITIKYRNGTRFEGVGTPNDRFDGIIYYADGSKYEGGFIRGKREGRAKNTLPNGDVYEGNFAQDRPNGNAVMRFSAGAVYEGEFVNGVVQGHGTLRYADGGIYVGEFVGAKRQGRGKLTLPSGDTYEGRFMQDSPHGLGVMRFTNGASYEGRFAGGSFQGHGKLHYANGGNYEGEFVSGKRHGHGEYHGNNGDVFKGEWNSDQLHGMGTEDLTNGIHYEGGYVGGKHQGKGRLADSKKEFTYEGEFLNDLFDGRGMFKSNDGYMYEGQFSRGLPDGIGAETTKNGDHYEGAFEQGVRKGQGILRGKRDQVEFTYEGQFKKGMAEGLGTANVGGVRIKGEFRDNAPWKAVFTLKDGQKYEIDRETQKVLKINPDGKKEDTETSEQLDFKI